MLGPLWQSCSYKQGSIGVSQAGGLGGLFPNARLCCGHVLKQGRHPCVRFSCSWVYPSQVGWGNGNVGTAGSLCCISLCRLQAGHWCVSPLGSPCPPGAGSAGAGGEETPRPRPDGGCHHHRCVAPVSPARGGRPPAAGAPAVQTSKGAARFIV